MIAFLRLLNRLKVSSVVIAGFDGFKTSYNETYADQALPTLGSGTNWGEVNREIAEMFAGFKAAVGDNMQIEFLTECPFDR